MFVKPNYIWLLLKKINLMDTESGFQFVVYIISVFVFLRLSWIDLSF